MARLLIGISVLFLSACAVTTTRGDFLPISEEKLQECPLPSQLASGSHSEVERWAVEQGFKYRECSSMQHELAEAVRLRQKLVAIDGGDK